MRIRTRSLLIMVFQGLTKVSQLIIGIILVRLISKETFGSYQQVMLVYFLIVGIFTIQIDRSLYYFIPRCGQKKQRNLVAQTLLVSSVISFIIGLAMFLSADLFANNFQNPDISRLIRVFAFFPLFERIAQLIPPFLISLDRPVMSGVYSTLNAVITILGVVIIFSMGYGISTALITKILIEVIFALAGIIIMIRLSPSGKWQFDKQLIIEQWNYCWPLMLTTTIGFLNLKLDGLLISAYFSKEVYAVYSMGAMELPIIALFTSSLSSAIMPNMVIEADNGRPKNSLNIWHEASRKSSILIFPTFFFFLICGYDFIVLLYTQAYSKAAWPFLIYLARLPLRVAIYAAIFRAIGYTKPIFYSALFDLVANLLISLTLLIAGNHGFLSYIGPSIGTFFGTAASVSYLLIVLSKKMEIHFSEVMRWKELGRIFLISLVCALLLWLTPVPFSNSIVLKLAASFSIYCSYLLIFLLITKSLHLDELELLKMPFSFLKVNFPNRFLRRNGRI